MLFVLDKGCSRSSGGCLPFHMGPDRVGASGSVYVPGRVGLDAVGDSGESNRAGLGVGRWVNRSRGLLLPSAPGCAFGRSIIGSQAIMQ